MAAQSPPVLRERVYHARAGICTPRTHRQGLDRRGYRFIPVVSGAAMPARKEY